MHENTHETVSLQRASAPFWSIRKVPFWELGEFHDTPDFDRALAFTFVGLFTQDVIDQSTGKRNNTWDSVIDEIIATRLHNLRKKYISSQSSGD